MAAVLTTANLIDPSPSTLHLVHYSCLAGLLAVLEEYQAQSFLGSPSYCSFCMGHARTTHILLPNLNVTSPKRLFRSTLLSFSYSLSHYCMRDGRQQQTA